MWETKALPSGLRQGIPAGWPAHLPRPRLQPHCRPPPPSAWSCVLHLSQVHLPRALPGEAACTQLRSQSLSPGKLNLRQLVMSDPFIQREKCFPSLVPHPPLELTSASLSVARIEPQLQGSLGTLLLLAIAGSCRQRGSQTWVREP